jgi:hypothetical protein
LASIHGRGGKFQIAAAAVVEAREWTLNITRSKDEDEAFGDAWRTQLGGIKEWSGSVEFNYDPAVVALHDAALGDVVVAVSFFPVGSTTAVYSGNAWLEFDLTVGVGGVARGTCNLEGDGALTYTPAA